MLGDQKRMTTINKLKTTTYPDISLQIELTRHIIYSVHDMSGARFSRYMLPAKLHARTLSSTAKCHPFFCQLAFFFFRVLICKKSDDDGRRIAFSNIQWTPATSWPRYSSWFLTARHVSPWLEMMWLWCVIMNCLGTYKVLITPVRPCGKTTHKERARANNKLNPVHIHLESECYHTTPP